LKKSSQSQKLVSAIVAALVFLVCPAVASAHPMQGVGDFYAGMLHPVTTMEFLLPIIALSLLAGQQARTSAIAMLVTFPVSLAIGAVIANPIHLPPVVSSIDLGLLAALGLLVAAAVPLPPAAAAALTTLLGLTIGLANGAELGSQVSPYRFVPGLALAGLMLVTYGIGCVRRLNAPWMRIGFRVVGSWIAAIGILVLSLKCV
jgi:urease accessory protein